MEEHGVSIRGHLFLCLLLQEISCDQLQISDNVPSVEAEGAKLPKTVRVVVLKVTFDS